MAWLTIEPSPTLPSSRHISSRFSTHRATSLLHVPYSRISSPSLYRPLRTPAYPATQLSSQNRSPTTPPSRSSEPSPCTYPPPQNHPRIVLLRSLRFSTNIHICFSCTHQLLALLFQSSPRKERIGSDRGPHGSSPGETKTGLEERISLRPHRQVAPAPLLVTIRVMFRTHPQPPPELGRHAYPTRFSSLRPTCIHTVSPPPSHPISEFGKRKFVVANCSVHTFEPSSRKPKFKFSLVVESSIF